MRTKIAGIVATGALIASTAQAQVQTGPGFFASVTGAYIVDSGKDNLAIVSGLPGTSPGDGFGGRLHGGYRFDSLWDIALGFSGVWLDKGRQAAAGINNYRTEAWYWAADAEVGYTLSGVDYSVRPFAGVRYTKWVHRLTSNIPANAKIESSTVGPRIGFDASTHLGSGFSLFAGVAGAVLFGKVRETGFGQAPVSGSNARTTWNFDGRLGIGFEAAPGVTIGVGYQVEYWSSVSHAAAFDGAGTDIGGGKSDRLLHGPFVRLAYNWGAPPLGVTAPPPPLPVTPAQYIVFFDFDRATLTAQGLTTIRQAAAAARAGNRARIGVTGHADRAGSDAYNMALSLRRANAVKDQLVREGIAATQIAVVGRGESQPLVPTADGVREPQNRRVEIVLQ